MTIVNSNSEQLLIEEFLEQQTVEIDNPTRIRLNAWSNQQLQSKHDSHGSDVDESDLHLIDDEAETWEDHRGVIFKILELDTVSIPETWLIGMESSTDLSCLLQSVTTTAKSEPVFAGLFLRTPQRELRNDIPDADICITVDAKNVQCVDGIRFFDPARCQWQKIGVRRYGENGEITYALGSKRNAELNKSAKTGKTYVNAPAVFRNFPGAYQDNGVNLLPTDIQNRFFVMPKRGLATVTVCKNG